MIRTNKTWLKPAQKSHPPVANDGAPGDLDKLKQFGDPVRRGSMSA